jgi:hypothetical protein
MNYDDPESGRCYDLDDNAGAYYYSGGGYTPQMYYDRGKFSNTCF